MGGRVIFLYRNLVGRHVLIHHTIANVIFILLICTLFNLFWRLYYRLKHVILIFYNQRSDSWYLGNIYTRDCVACLQITWLVSIICLKLLLVFITDHYRNHVHQHNLSVS